MKYNRLHINRFGTLQNRTLEFAEGLNVIYAPNKEDKASLEAFLETMQFGMADPYPEEGKPDLYTRFYPETGSSTYGGVLEFSQENTTYSIYRNFKRDPEGYTLMDEKAGRQLLPTGEQYYHILGDMTRPLYRTTVALGHLENGIGKDYSDDLLSRIVNLRQAGSQALDIAAAKERLEADRYRLEQEYSQASADRAKELAEQLKRLSDEKALMEGTNDLPLWEKERRLLQGDCEAMKDRQAALIQAIQNEETYLENHAKETRYSLQEAENRCQKLLARREKLLKQYPEPLSGPFKNLYLVLSVLCAALAAAALVFSFLSVTAGNTLNTALGFLGAVLMVCGFLFSWKRMQAQMAFSYVDKALTKLYRQMLPEMPDRIDQQNLQQFLELMEDLKNRRKHLQKCRKELDSVNGHLFQLEERQERMMNSMDQKKKEFGNRIQMDEKIGLILAELDGLSAILDRNARIKEELDAVDLAAGELDRLSRTVFLDFGAFLQEKASEIMASLTKERCSSLTIGEDGSVTITGKEGPVSLKEQDYSTLEQIHLSLRLACIDYFWPGRKVPLILDENFFMYAPAKLNDTLNWLNEEYPGQILIFTAHTRETQVFDRFEIEYREIRL